VVQGSLVLRSPLSGLVTPSLSRVLGKLGCLWVIGVQPSPKRIPSSGQHIALDPCPPFRLQVCTCLGQLLFHQLPLGTLLVVTSAALSSTTTCLLFRLLTLTLTLTLIVIVTVISTFAIVIPITVAVNVNVNVNITVTIIITL
jgi:hypothetical protein